MKYFWWDGCNKWLYFGRGLAQNKKCILMFGEWLNWFPLGRQTFASWSLFRIVYDNGAWWAFDLDNALILDGMKHGFLNCFIEITILGIGIRRCYHRKVIWDEEGFKNSLKENYGSC